MSFHGHHTYGYNNKLPDGHHHHHQHLPASTDEAVEMSDGASTSFVSPPGYGYYQASKLNTYNNGEMTMIESSNGVVSQPATMSAPGRGIMPHQRSNLPPASELLSLNGSGGTGVGNVTVGSVVRGPPPDVRQYAMPQTPSSNTLPSISSLGQKSSAPPYFYQQQPNYPQPSPSIPPSPYLNTPSTYYSITEPGTPAPQMFNQAEHSQVASPSMSVNFHSSNPPSLISSVPASPASSLSNLQRSPTIKRSNVAPSLTPDTQQQQQQSQQQQTQQRQQFQQQSSAGTSGFQQPYQHQEQRQYYQIEQQSQQLQQYQSVQLYQQHPPQQQEQLQQQQPTLDGSGSSITPSRNIRTPRTPKVTNKYRGGRTRNAALNSILQMHNTPGLSSSVAAAGVSPDVNISTVSTLASTSYIAGPAASFCDDGPTVKEHLQWQQARQRVLQYEAGSSGNSRSRRGKSSSASPHKAFIPPLSHNDGSGTSSSPSSAASQPHYYVESSPASSTSRQPTVYSQGAPTASYSAAAPPRPISGDIVVASAAAPQNTAGVPRRSACKDSFETLQSSSSPLRVRDSLDDALASTIASVAAGEGGFNLETLLDPSGEGDEESLLADELISNRMTNNSVASTRGRGTRRSRRGSSSGGSGGTIGYFRGGSATTASGNMTSSRNNALQAPSPSALQQLPSNEGFIAMAEQNLPDDPLKTLTSRGSKRAGGEQKPSVKRRRLNNASNQQANSTDGALILSDAVFQHPQQQLQQQRGLSQQEYVREQQYQQMIPPSTRNNQLQIQQHQQQHLSEASSGSTQAMRICVQNPPDALGGFPPTATTIHIVRQPSDGQTIQKDYTSQPYDGAVAGNPPVIVAVSRQMQSGHLRYQQQPFVIRQMSNTAGNFAQTQQNGGVAGSSLVQNYTSYDQQQKPIYQQAMPEQYPTYRAQQQPAYHEQQHQAYQGQQRAHESQQQQQHQQQQNQGHYVHYQQMHDGLYRMQQSQQTYDHQPSQQMVCGHSQLQQQHYAMASGALAQASYTEASYPQQISAMSTGQLTHPSYYSSEASAAHGGTYLNDGGIRISTEPSDLSEVAAAEAQAEEDRKYSIKYHHLKRTCRAVVFKNAALADEVSRLRQRVQIVSDERWRLGKQLQHDRRNHIRRIQTKMRRWEAVRALQAVNQQQEEEDNSSEATISDSEIAPSGDEMSLLEKLPPKFDVEEDDGIVGASAIKRPTSRSDVKPIRLKITNSRTKEGFASVSSLRSRHEEPMENTPTKMFSSAVDGDNSICASRNLPMLLRRRDGSATSSPVDDGVGLVDGCDNVTPKSRLRVCTSNDKTPNDQATVMSIPSCAEQQKLDQCRLKVSSQQQKRRVRLKKNEKSSNEADDTVRRRRRRQQSSKREAGENNVSKRMRKQCSNQSAETISEEKALIVQCSNGSAAPASFENGISPRTRSATRRSLNTPVKLESVEVDDDDFSSLSIKRKTASLEKLSVVDDESFKKVATTIIKNSAQASSIVESSWLANSQHSLEDSEEDTNDNNNRRDKNHCEEKNDKEKNCEEEKRDLTSLRKASARHQFLGLNEEEEKAGMVVVLDRSDGPAAATATAAAVE